MSLFDLSWNIGWCSCKSNDLLTTTSSVDYIWRFQFSKLFQPFQFQGGAIATAVTHLDTCGILFSSQNRYGQERKMFGNPMTVWVVHRHFVCFSFEKFQAGLLQNLFFLDGKWLGQPCYVRHDPRLCLNIWQRVNNKKMELFGRLL